tara:strand:- start:1824 stop:2261 length:438 start_codon:yes stop_codon:yes gene_type:complete
VTAPQNFHASVVAFGPRTGILIVGPSSSGKSTLALGLIQAGAQLVADDQVLVSARNGALFARTPRSIAGMIEVRGVGLLRLTHRNLSQVALVVDMGLPPGPRLPTPQMHEMLGVPLPYLPGSTDPCFMQGLCAMMTGTLGPKGTT